MDDIIELMENEINPLVDIEAKIANKKLYLRCPHCEEGYMKPVNKTEICMCDVCSYTLSKDDVKSQILSEIEEIEEIINE